jgi:hypothetical protein
VKNLIKILPLASLFVASSAFASMTIRYYNSDSKAYEAEAICSGSKQDPVKFSASTTSSVSIQGSTPCKVTLNGVTHEFTGDVKIKIKDGKITIE